MIIKFQKGGYISSRNYDTNLNQSFGNLLSMYKPDPIPDINANTQNILGVIQTNSNIYQNRQRLDLQRDEQALQAQVINLRTKDQENQMLKDNQDNFTKLLTMDDNIFLEADQKRFDEELKADGLDDETLANTLDFRDTDAIYKMMQKRTAKISSYKNAFTNKQTYTNLTKELENLEKSINFKELEKVGPLKLDVLNKYQDDVLNLRSKIERIRYEGVNDVTPEELVNLRSYNPKSFLDQEAYGRIQNVKERTNAAEMTELESEANVSIIKSDMITKANNDFAKANTNPTIDQLRQHAQLIEDIKDPTAKAKRDATMAVEMMKLQNDMRLAGYKSQLNMQEDNNASRNDIMVDRAKPATASETVDTYNNGSTRIEKGEFKGAAYGGVTSEFLKAETKASLNPADGSFTLTKAQVEKYYNKDARDKLGVNKQLLPAGKDTYILKPDYPAKPPAGTTPANPIIKNNTPAPTGNFTGPTTPVSQNYIPSGGIKPN